MAKQCKHIVVSDRVIGDNILVGSDNWWEWLSAVNSFRYEFAGNIILLVKVRGYWQAQKRDNGKLRQKHVGGDSSVTEYNLKSVCELLCSNRQWTNYLRARSQKRREKPTIKDYKRNYEYLKDERDRLARQVERLESELKKIS